MADLGPPPKRRTKLSFIGSEAFEPDDEDRSTPDTSSDTNEGSVQSDNYVMYENPQTGETFLVLESSTAAGPEGIQRSRKIIPKRIISDFEGNDEIIINLKERNHSDEKVVEVLAHLGPTKYTARSVANRWARLRRALEVCEEEDLDDELYDWQMGEDDKLQASVDFALVKCQEEMERLEEKKWKLVADHLANLLGTKKYTSKACRERYESLLTGDPLLPVELDPDQEGRSLARQERISSAKIARAKLNADAERMVAEKKRAAIERKRDKIEAQERQRAQKEEDQARQKQKVQEEKRKAQEKVDAQKRRQREVARWEMSVWKAENSVYIKLTGKPLDQKRRTLNHYRDYCKSKLPQIVISDGEEDSGDDMYSDNELDENPKSKAKRAAQFKGPIPPGRANVTAETIASPRSIMSLHELDILVVKRNLPRRTAEETHPQLVARLHWTEHYIMMTDQLASLLLAYNSRGKGTKIVKAGRLAVLDAEHSQAGQAGVTSTDPDFARRYAASYPSALSKPETTTDGYGEDEPDTLDDLFQEYQDTLMEEDD